MTTGTTKSGFEFELRDHVFDDYEVNEAIVDFINERTTGNLVALEHKLFDGSEKCRENAREFLKGKKGYFTANEMEAFIAEILQARPDGKNSSPSPT